MAEIDLSTTNEEFLDSGKGKEREERRRLQAMAALPKALGMNPEVAENLNMSMPTTGSNLHKEAKMSVATSKDFLPLFNELSESEKDSVINDASPAILGQQVLNKKQKKEVKNFLSNPGRTVNSTKNRQDSLSGSEMFSLALIGLLPSVIGAAFGGSEGGAIGAEAGQTGVNTFLKLNQNEREIQAQMELQDKKHQQALDLQNRRFQQQVALSAVGKKDEKVTETQAKARQLGARAKFANENLTRLMTKEGFDPTAGKEAIRGLLTRIVPKEFEGFFQSEKSGQFVQAREQFLEAVVRDVTGAAIGSEEKTEADRALIPQPGDSDDVVLQKHLARQLMVMDLEQKGAVEGMRGGSGVETIRNYFNQSKALLSDRKNMKSKIERRRELMAKKGN